MPAAVAVLAVLGSLVGVFVTVLSAPPDGEADVAVPLLAGRGLVKGGPTAYVCRQFTCQAPVTTPAELRETLHT